MKLKKTLCWLIMLVIVVSACGHASGDDEVETVDETSFESLESSEYSDIAFVETYQTILNSNLEDERSNEKESSWTDIQIKAHEIAEIARSMGLDEDDPIIVRAKEMNLNLLKKMLKLKNLINTNLIY